MNAPAERMIPERFDVSLAVTPDLVVKLKLADGVLEMAQSFVIDCAEVAQIVADNRNSNLKAIATFKELKKGFVAPAKTIIANAEALFDPGLEELEAAVKHSNANLLGWQQSEDKRLAAEKAERDAEDRRIRQEAERKAAEVRAKAEEEARENQRRAAEAEAKRQQAIREGNAKEAARQAAERARQEEKAAAAIENGNAKAQEATLAAAAVSASTPAPVATKIAGNSFRENWIAEFKSGLDAAAVKLQIVQAICGNAVNSAAARPDLLALLEIDMSAANRRAKALKKLANIPGMETRDAPIAAGSRK